MTKLVEGWGSPVAWYDRALWVLLLYFVVLIMFLSQTHLDVVDAIATVAFFYGAPLGIFLVVYIAIMAAVYLRTIDTVSWDWSKLISISARLAVATLPMFYLDDDMAKLIVYLHE